MEKINWHVASNWQNLIFSRAVCRIINLLIANNGPIASRRRIVMIVGRNGCVWASWCLVNRICGMDKRNNRPLCVQSRNVFYGIALPFVVGNVRSLINEFIHAAIKVSDNAPHSPRLRSPSNGCTQTWHWKCNTFANPKRIRGSPFNLTRFQSSIRLINGWTRALAFHVRSRRYALWWHFIDDM